MLFAFRGIRLFQLILAVLALAAGVGAVVSLKAFADNRGLPFIFLALILGVIFLWAFGTTLRAPTSFVAVAPERTRIRFAGFIDTVVANQDIVGARLTTHALWKGIGVRTAFRGDVALATWWGSAAELTFREPVRVWLIPKLIPVRAGRLVVTVRNPQKLVEHFTPVAPAPSRAAPPPRKMKHRGFRTR